MELSKYPSLKMSCHGSQGDPQAMVMTTSCGPLHGLEAVSW